MKKLLIASLSLAFLGNATVSNCGIDLNRAHDEQLPPLYCFARQAAGHITFGGQLSLPCEGEACPVPNTTLNFLQ